MNNNIEETVKSLVEYAKYSKQEELDKVITAVVNFVREQRIEILNETLQLLKENAAYEAVISKRQRQEATKLSERKTI